MNETVILYGKDECRLYEAALAIEQVMLKRQGIRGIPGNWKLLKRRQKESKQKSNRERKTKVSGRADIVYNKK